MAQELEMEISKLRSDLLSLRECIANDAMTSGNSALQEIARQLEARENEITRLKDENVHLRNVFSGKAASAKSLALSSYSSCKDVDTSLINEDGELILAFEAQKKTLRQLEEELQEKTMRWDIEREELVGELERLRGEYEKHQVILLGGLAPGSHSQTESFLQNEVKRLSAEYLELQDKYDLKSAKCRRLQKHINDLTKRLKDAGIDDVETKAETLEKLSTQVLPVVRKKEREYMGMFKIEPEDVNVMLKHLLDLKPKVAKTLLPCLPSYIIFMCVRHTDYNNDERTLQSLILGYSKSVTKPLRKRTSDIDFGVLWLANTLRFINNLKQYSGEPRFGKDNTKIQNKQCLQNFDLSEFRQVLSDSAIFLYQTVVRCMEEKLQPLAVPAILEHEAISGLTSSTRARSSSTVANQPVVKKALDELLAQLTWFHRTLALNGIDVELIVQCFRQLFYFLCASSLNNLLLRKEYCHWSKGMQIRYNLSHLEQWAREIKLQDAKMTEMLAPIIQASQLLQARKTDADVDTIAEMCSKLTPNQIIKLLNLYTPADSFEEAVSESFIKKMQQRLSEIRSTTDTTLMMDVKHTFVLEFPFTPSSIRLEDIEIPEVLNLPMLKKI